MNHESIEAIFAGWADLVPAPARKLGWEVCHPSYSTRVTDEQLTHRWTADLYGPVEVQVIKQETYDRKEHLALYVSTTHMANLAADSHEVIARLIADWVEATGLGRIR